MKERHFRSDLIKKLNTLIKSSEAAQQKQAKKESKIKVIITTWLPAITGVAAIVISIVFGCITYQQADSLSKQEQKISSFDVLLNNTKNTLDTLIATNRKLSKTNILLQDQLEINRKTDSVTNDIYHKKAIGDKNRFLGAVYKLGYYIDMWKAEEEPFYEGEGLIKRAYIDPIANILVSQFSNPYILQNTELNKLWVEAYIHTQVYTDDNVFEPAFGKKFYGRPASVTDKLGKKYPRDLESCYNAILKAFNEAEKVYK